MASLMERIRHWLGADGEHTQEHADLRRDLIAQQTSIRRLDAYIDARGIRSERRRMMTLSHPKRRATDG